MKDSRTVNIKNSRQSNFELLRILAMVMIILHHITYHCIRVQLESKDLYVLGECFNSTTFFKSLLLPQFFMAAGKIGNIIFILLTGYFLINKEINITKQIKKILSQLIFTVPILIFFSFIYYKVCSNSFVGIQNFNLINTGYWFIGYYIGIIAIAYCFLNRMLNKLEKNDYIKVLAIMFAIITIAFLRNIISNVSTGLTTLFVGVFIYSLGGYIRLYNPFKNVRTLVFVLIIIVSIVVICINFYNDTLNKISLAQENNEHGMYQQLAEIDEYSIFNLLIGISLFEIFKRIKIENSKVINYIASSTFIVYLLHDNDLIRYIWRRKNWIEILYYDFNKYLILCFDWVIFIFTVGIIIYTLYCLFSKIIHTKQLKKILYTTTDNNLDTNNDQNQIRENKTDKIYN